MDHVPPQSRRAVLAWNLTDHPNSEWTIQQFRNSVPLEGASRFVTHDRDGIFTPAVDEALRSMSLQVLKTPVRAPQENPHCERFIGTARRECLDWVMPLNERHLRSVLVEWMSHYNGERPHSALGPALPDYSNGRTTLTGHRLPTLSCRRQRASWRAASSLQAGTYRCVVFCGVQEFHDIGRRGKEP